MKRRRVLASVAAGVMAAGLMLLPADTAEAVPHGLQHTAKNNVPAVAVGNGNPSPPGLLFAGGNPNPTTVSYTAGAVAANLNHTNNTNAVPVPEPGTLILIGSGVAALGVVVRRRNS